MPPAVIGGVCQFTYKGTSTLRPWAVVLHFDIDTDIGDARNAAIVDQAKVLNNAWFNHIRPVTSTGAQLNETCWLDLDSLTGSSGCSAETDLPADIPASGTHTGDVMAMNCAVLMTKTVAGGRSRRKGRTFWPGVSETDQNNSQLTPTAITAWETAVAGWLNASNQESTGLPGGATYSSRLVVPHLSGASSPGFSEITALNISNLLATQRRRMRG